MPHRIIPRCAIGAFAALATACASTRVTRFDQQAPLSQRTPASDIRFYAAAKPSCPYDEIGRVTAQSRLFVTWDRVVSAARDAAHEMGGDAVINVQDASRISGATVSSSGVITEETSSLSGIVIRFRHLDCMD